MGKKVRQEAERMPATKQRTNKKNRLSWVAGQQHQRERTTSKIQSRNGGPSQGDAENI